MTSDARYPTVSSLAFATSTLEPDAIAASAPDSGYSIPHTARPLLPSPLSPSPKFRMDLRLGRHCLDLRLSGPFDDRATERLGVVLSSLDRLTPPLQIDVRGVTSMGITALIPLAEAAQRRAHHEFAPLSLKNIPEVLQTLLADLGVPEVQYAHPNSWDLEQHNPVSTGRHKGHLRLIEPDTDRTPPQP